MPPMRAIVFMGLNVVRFLSIVTLVLVFASQILVMVTNIKAVNFFVANSANASDYLNCDYIEGSTVPNQPAGVFWAVVATLLIIVQSIILLMSEFGWPIRFFDRYFPVLGSNFGLGPLGIFQGLIATQILSHHVDDYTLVAAFFLFAIGCLNMLLGLIFRESAKEKRSISTWRAEAKGVLPQSTSDGPKKFMLTGNSGPFVSRNLSTNIRNEKSDGYGWSNGGDNLKSEHGSFRSIDKQGYGFGRQGEKAAELKGYLLQRPEDSLPRYASPPPPSGNLARNKSSRSSTSSFSSPFRGSREVEFEVERASTRSRSPASHSHSRSHSRSSGGERSGTPVPKFKSSSTVV